MRAKYPSDISPEQFESIRALLESARKRTRPRRVDLYEVFCAVLYLLNIGINSANKCHGNAAKHLHQNLDSDSHPKAARL